MIEHLSVSAIRTFCSSKNVWYKKYITKEIEIPCSQKMIEGSIVHLALENINNQCIGVERKSILDMEATILEFVRTLLHEEVDKRWDEIQDWTHTKQKIKDKLFNIILWYIDSQGMPHDVVEAEAAFKTTLPIEGSIIPLKGIVDALHMEGEDLVIKDYKLTGMFVNNAADKPYYEIAAWAYYFLVSHFKKKAPARMEFVQIKNAMTEKGFSVQPLVYDYTSTENQLAGKTFLNLYQLVEAEVRMHMSRQEWQILPNPFDMFDGAFAWNEYKKTVKRRYDK